MPLKNQKAKSKKQKSRGLFISFEGIEGCGKTTQVKLLARWLRARGFQVVVTREPGGPYISEKIRRLLLDARNHAMSPMAELLLLEASRAQHVAEVIAPALKGGEIVICDRFADSSTAYQGYGRGLGCEMVDSLNRTATGGCWPELTFILDLLVSEGFKRAAGRRRRFDRMESEERAFHQRVRRGYRKLAELEPKRVKLLDARLAPEKIQERVREAVEEFI